MPYFSAENFTLLEKIRLFCVLFVIYTMKHLIIYFMSVNVLNAYGVN